MAARRAEDSAVIPDAEDEAGGRFPAARTSLRRPDLFNQCEFAEWPGHASRINAA